MNGAFLQRAEILISQNRLSEAEKELNREISENPENDRAFALLAHCLSINEQFEKALDAVKTAISLQPNEPFNHYVLARTHYENNNMDEAERAIDNAIRLMPFEADFFLIKGYINLDRKKWEQALKYAETGLKFDAEHIGCLNLRTTALIKLNRKQDAEQTIDYALHKEPENTFSHANKGWAKLEMSDYKEALNHFKEALRLDPNNEFAQNGLKEAIKAKFPLYRLVLKYYLWNAKLSRGKQWIFIVGLYIIYRIVLWISETHPELSPVLYPVIGLYILFAFSSWIALPLSNLFLRLHPLGRHALNRDEKKASDIIGLLLLGAILFIITYLVIDKIIFLFAALYFAFMTIPVSGTFFMQPNTKGRKNLRVYTVALAIFGLLGVFTPYILFGMIFLIGIFGFGFIANYYVIKK